MPFDDPPTGDDEPRRIEVQRTECMGGLLDQCSRIGALGTSHVAEMLDRMHGATVADSADPVGATRLDRASRWAGTV